MTTTQPTRRRSIPLFAALFAVSLLGADAPTQDIDAGGMTFQVPGAWKKLDATGMRKAHLKIEPAKGDELAAELVVFAFPGGAGGVDANIERWQRTFKDKDGNPPKVDVKTVKGKNTDATRVEIAGHYFPTTFPGQPKQVDHDNYRLLGVIVIADESSYFLRLVGPEKTVTDARPDFEKLIASIKVDKK